jgi:O-antigen ligase
MTAVLPLWLFAPLATLVLVLAMTAPLSALVGVDLALVALPGQWRIGGVWVDAADLVNAGLLLALWARGRRAAGAPRLARPLLLLWLALGLLLSAAYLTAPDNAPFLTGPLRVGYQLYRYCWKPILYFPLYFLLLAERRRLGTALLAAVTGADLCALWALPQGFHGLRASGPFVSPNTLGAVLVVPALISAIALLAGESRRWRLFHAASLLLIGRALLFAGSRGALMAVLVGLAVALALLARRPASRARMARAAPWALAGAALVLLASPGVLERPNVQRLLTLLHPAQEETFRWRLHARWPHFWQQVEAHPWLGVGSEVDRSLGESANTPHNGYIAIAVASGLPALAIYLIVAGLALRGAWRARHGSGDGAGGLPLAVAAAAGLAGLLVHSSVDTILTIPYVAKLFWLLAGMGLAPPRPAAVASAAPAVAEGGARRGERAGGLAAGRSALGGAEPAGGGWG